MTTPRSTCPFCDAALVPHFLCKHVLNKHLNQLYSNQANKAALTFNDDRKTLPRIKIGDQESKYICYKCECLISRDAFANKHLGCLKESKKIAAELLEKLTPIDTQTPPSAPTQVVVEQVTDKEILAYRKVIFNMAAEIEDALFWRAKYDMATNDSEIWAKLKDLPEPDKSKYRYDVESENKKEAKYCKLDSRTLQKASDTKY